LRAANLAEKPVTTEAQRSQRSPLCSLCLCGCSCFGDHDKPSKSNRSHGPTVWFGVSFSTNFVISIIQILVINNQILVINSQILVINNQILVINSQILVINIQILDEELQILVNDDQILVDDIEFVFNATERTQGVNLTLTIP